MLKKELLKEIFFLIIIILLRDSNLIFTALKSNLNKILYIFHKL